MKNIRMYLLRTALIPCVLTSLGLSARAETNPKYYAVEVSATVQAAPPQITLKWAPDSNATGYTVSRKAPTATSWTQVTTLAGSATAWPDVSVSNGGSYEYQVTKSTSLGYQGAGYVLAGINAPMIENRGKVVLVVDSTYSSALSSELARLQQDLVGDGWTVLRHDVSRNDSAANIKNVIKANYNADPSNVKSVFLFGHVPVPYSGDLNPDGHPDHKGAWPADAFYGDMDGVWTDSGVNDTSAGSQRNWNVPGDGKFDQSTLPSNVELQVGRVDLSNMTCYSNKIVSRSELDLLRAYLNKDHNFRIGQVSLPRRGLICDNFGEHSGEAFAASGWRNFAPFFGAENDIQVNYGTFFSTLKDNAYLCAYGTGGGTFYSADGIGSSDDFATTDIQTVFTMFLGSYFGDWDNESAFLRAPLGSGSCLASAWAGRPHCFFHHMGLGETLGYGAKISQNNNFGGLYLAQNFGSYGIHVALMGDPTLRLHPVIPPANVSAVAGAGVVLNWSVSPDANIQGYTVYRASSVNGPFTRISGSSLLNVLGMTDVAGVAGNVYMVRAVKLEQSGSGTYYNPSEGVIVTAGSGSIIPPPATPAAPSNIRAFVDSSSQVTVYWNDNSSNESGFTLMRKAGANGSYTSIPVAANNIGRSDSGLAAGTQYFYKICAWNSAGNSALSSEISVTTPGAGPATPAAPSNLRAFVDSSSQVTVYWDDNSSNESGFTLMRKAGVNGSYTSIPVSANIIGRSDSGLGAGTQYFYKICAWNSAGNSAFSSEVSATTPGGIQSAAAVRPLSVNTWTQGSWKGAFGTQGYQLMQEGVSLPAFASVSASGKSDWVWNWSTSDASALQKASATDRLAACFYSAPSFNINVGITDGQTHKVSFYCLDWDQANRSQRIDVLDATTGTTLNSLNLAGFEKGQYASFDVKGSVVFRFTATGPVNSVVSGIFFDPPSASL